MMLYQDVIESLDELVAFFRRIGLDGHAGSVHQVRERLCREGLEAVPELIGVDFWGVQVRTLTLVSNGGTFLFYQKNSTYTKRMRSTIVYFFVWLQP